MMVWTQHIHLENSLLTQNALTIHGGVTQDEHSLVVRFSTSSEPELHISAHVRVLFGAWMIPSSVRSYQEVQRRLTTMSRTAQ